MAGATPTILASHQHFTPAALLAAQSTPDYTLWMALADPQAIDQKLQDGISKLLSS